MIKDNTGTEVVYFIGGSAGICPKCGNGNAMLDGGRHVTGGRYIRMLECRDCGHSLDAGDYTEVAISYDGVRRVYQGKTENNMLVDLAPFDNENTNRPDISILMEYLRNHPTPDTWGKIEKKGEIRLYTCADCGRQRYAGMRCECGSEDLTLSFEHFASMIARRAPDTDVECSACETDLMDEDVQAYQHDGGWMFGGTGMPLPRMRFWLSIKCPKCGYETSFSRFGIKK